MDQSIEPISSGKIVAVVDDDPAVRNSLKFSLETEGLVVRAFAAGQELMEAVKDETINCVVIEFRLEDIDGVALTDHMRSKGLRTPIIMLTRHPNKMLKQYAAQRNIPIVEKPLVGNTLMDTIRRLLI